MTHVVSFDFESVGGVPAVNGFTQLAAACVRLSDSAVVRTFDAYANMDGYVSEKRCMDEFWSKFPKLYDAMMRKCAESKLGPHDVVSSFVQWLQQLQADGITEFYLVTDNATYDSGLLKFFSKVDTMYLQGVCRDIVDVSCVYLGICRKFLDLSAVDGSTKKAVLIAINDMRRSKGQPELIREPDWPTTHDHNAVNDAVVIACRYAWVMREVSAL